MNGARKPVDRMTRYEIIDALLEDGLRIDAFDAAEVSRTIQSAARRGALLWSETRIVSTLAGRPLDLRKTEDR